MTVLGNLDKFAYLGGFSGSSGGRGGFDPKTSNNGVFADAAAFNKKMKVLFLGIGSVEGPGPRTSASAHRRRHSQRLLRVAGYGSRVADMAPLSERFRSTAVQVVGRLRGIPRLLSKRGTTDCGNQTVQDATALRGCGT